MMALAFHARRTCPCAQHRLRLHVNYIHVIWAANRASASARQCFALRLAFRVTILCLWRRRRHSDVCVSHGSECHACRLASASRCVSRSALPFYAYGDVGDTFTRLCFTRIRVPCVLLHGIALIYPFTRKFMR